MKQFKYSSFIIAVILVFAISATHAAFSFAQSETITKTSSLEEKLDKLADSQVQLSETISELLVQEEVPTEPTAAMASSTTHPVCTIDIANNTSSTTYKDTDWTPLMTEQGSSYYHNSFIDLNGDGLLDYLFVSQTGTFMKDCVYLNHGAGWERVHVCYAVYNYPVSGEWNYRGDCADFS